MGAKLAQLWIGRLLLGFVLFSAGFSIGRQTASSKPTADGGVLAGETGSKVLVYSAHATVRCASCTTLEFMARQLLNDEFAAEMASGAIEFRTIDFMKSREFATHFDIVSSTLLVVRIDDGREAAFERLDEIWSRFHDPANFAEYMGDALRDHLGQLPAGVR